MSTVTGNYKYGIETAPLRFTSAEPIGVFRSDFANYQASCKEFMDAAKLHVYENPEADQIEYMIHCGWLAHQIEAGVRLIVFAKNYELAGIDKQIQMVQEQVDDYIARMHMWHGAVKEQTDLPKALLQGFADEEAGRVNEITDSQFDAPNV